MKDAQMRRPIYKAGIEATRFYNPPAYQYVRVTNFWNHVSWIGVNPCPSESFTRLGKCSIPNMLRGHSKVHMSNRWCGRVLQARDWVYWFSAIGMRYGHRLQRFALTDWWLASATTRPRYKFKSLTKTTSCSCKAVQRIKKRRNSWNSLRRTTFLLWKGLRDHENFNLIEKVLDIL